MQTGNWLHYPEKGGALDQQGWLMDLIKIAWRTWYVFGYMRQNEMTWRVTDADYAAWVTEAANG